MTREMLRPRYTHEQACHLSSLYVLATARVASASTSLHVERLRHLKAVVLKTTDALWAILHYEQSWLTDIQLSLEWFRQQHQGSDTFLSAWEDLRGIINYIHCFPNGWKRAVNRAKKTAILPELWLAECQQHQGLAFRAFTKAGAVVVPSEVVELESKHELCASVASFLTTLEPGRTTP